MNNVLQMQGIFEQGYGLIAKKVMRDKKLSIEAKAIYSYICSFAGNGTTAFPSAELICAELNISDTRFYKYRKELVEAGYITIKKHRKNGKRANNIYEIVFYPSALELQHRQFLGIEIEGANSNSKKNSVYSSEFEEFWSIYPRKIDKKRASTSCKTAIKNNSLETILKGTRQYAEQIKRNKTETQYIKHASTFLNNESFLNDFSEGEGGSRNGGSSSNIQPNSGYIGL